LGNKKGRDQHELSKGARSTNLTAPPKWDLKDERAGREGQAEKEKLLSIWGDARRERDDQGKTGKTLVFAFLEEKNVQVQKRGTHTATLGQNMQKIKGGLLLGVEIMENFGS